MDNKSVKKSFRLKDDTKISRWDSRRHFIDAAASLPEPASSVKIY